MITAKGDVFDKVLGLELGADDFVVKPFDMKELSARVKAVLRRSSAHNNQSDDEAIKFDNIEISRQKYELKLRGSLSIFPRRSWSCSTSLRQTTTASLRGISCLTRSGALITSETQEPLTFT